MGKEIFTYIKKIGDKLNVWYGVNTNAEGGEFWILKGVITTNDKTKKKEIKNISLKTILGYGDSPVIINVLKEDPGFYDYYLEHHDTIEDGLGVGVKDLDENGSVYKAIQKIKKQGYKCYDYKNKEINKLIDELYKYGYGHTDNKPIKLKVPNIYLKKIVKEALDYRNNIIKSAHGQSQSQIYYRNIAKKRTTKKPKRKTTKRKVTKKNITKKNTKK